MVLPTFPPDDYDEDEDEEEEAGVDTRISDGASTTVATPAAVSENNEVEGVKKNSRLMSLGPILKCSLGRMV